MALILQKAFQSLLVDRFICSLENFFKKMEQRRKIVIPTSAEPLEEPHFDTEATLTARPVVPLTESAAADTYESAQPSVISSVARRSPWLLVLLIGAAALAGAAGALAIDYLRNPQHKEATAVTTTTAQPSSSMTTGAQPVAQPTEELKTLDEVGKAAQPPAVNRDVEKVAEKDAPVTANPVEKQPAPAPQPKASVSTPKEESSRKESKETAKSAKARDNSDDEQRADNERERKQQRKEQRRARIVDEYHPEDLPAGNRRSKEGVTRIRDIFEGSRP